MATYSHSKLSTFEQCRYKYKLHYIDKVEVEVPTTVEALLIWEKIHRPNFNRVEFDTVGRKQKHSY